jgi:hypothetical protein
LHCAAALECQYRRNRTNNLLVSDAVAFVDQDERLQRREGLLELRISWSLPAIQTGGSSLSWTATSTRPCAD